MADYKDIAGRIRTTAADGVAVEAQEMKDLLLDKSQQEVNADVQQGLSDRYTKEETYNRNEIESLVDPTNYVSVVATSQTTSISDLLPATGEADTIYRIGNWDGTQYDPTVYALYSWNDTAYVCLAVRSFVGEVYDISVNHPDGQGNPTPYADLAAALGSGGANIPTAIRKGGMSIKFIQNVPNSDDKYVQYMCKTSAWSSTPADWEKVNNVSVSQNTETGNIDISVSERTLSVASAEDISEVMANQGYEIDNLNLLDYIITANGTFGTTDTREHACIPVSEGEMYIIKYTSINGRVAFATSNSYSSGGAIPLVPGTLVINITEIEKYYKFVIPSGCSYLLFNAGEHYNYPKCYKYEVEDTLTVIPLSRLKPLEIGNFYQFTDSTASNYAPNAIPEHLRKINVIVIIKTASYETQLYKFIGANLTVWNNTNRWERLPNIFDCIYNITKEIPLQSGYYQITDATSQNFIPTILVDKFGNNVTKSGFVVRYEVSQYEWEIRVFTGAENETSFKTAKRWKRIALGDEVDDISNNVNAIETLFAKQEIENYYLLPYALNMDGNFGTGADVHRHACIQVNKGEKYFIRTNNNTNVRYAFATSNSYSSGGAIPLVPNTSVIAISELNTEYTIAIPDSCSYLLFNAGERYDYPKCFKYAKANASERLDLSNVEELLIVGQSHAAGMGSLKNKSWSSYLSALTDWNVINCAFDGGNYIEALWTILKNTTTVLGVKFSDVNKGGVCLDFLGGNAENAYFQNGMDGKYAIKNIKRFYSTLKSWGYDIIPSTAFGDQPNSISAIQEIVAKEMGLQIVDIDNECARINRKDFLPYWLYGHFGSRTNANQYTTLLQALKLRRPRTAIKLYRNRSSVVDNAELLYDNAFERLRLWEEISIGHRGLSTENEKYVDRLDLYSNLRIIGPNFPSEYKKIRSNTSVEIEDKLLVEFILPTTSDGIKNLQLKFGLTGTPNVYIRKYIDESLAIAWEPVQAVFYIPNDVSDISVGDVFTDTLNSGVTFEVVQVISQSDRIYCTATDSFSTPGQTIDTLTRIGDSTTFTATSLLKGVPEGYMDRADEPIGLWEEIAIDSNGIVSIADASKYMDYDKVAILIDGATAINDVYATYDKPKFEKEYKKDLEYSTNDDIRLLGQTIKAFGFANGSSGYTLNNNSGNSYYWNGQETIGSTTYKHIPEYFENKSIGSILHLKNGDNLTFNVSDFVRNTILEDKTSHFRVRLVARYFPASNFDINAQSFTITQKSFDFAKLGFRLQINDELDAVVTREFYLPPSFTYQHFDIYFDAKSDSQVKITAMDDDVELLYLEIIK